MTATMASASLHLAAQFSSGNKFKALEHPKFKVSCFTRFGDRPVCSALGRRYTFLYCSYVHFKLLLGKFSSCFSFENVIVYD